MKPCSCRCCFSRLRRTEASERSRSLSAVSSALVTVRRPRRRSPPGAALVRVGFGTSRRFREREDRRAPGRSAVVVPGVASRCALRARLPRRAGGAPRPRRGGAPDPRTACAPLPRPCGARPRCARAQAARLPRRGGALRLSACWRSSASRTRASCSACARASRSSSVRVRSTTPPVRGRCGCLLAARAWLQRDARTRGLRLRRRVQRLAARRRLCALGRSGDAAALLLDHDSLRPAAGEALAHGVGVALQRKRLPLPTRIVLSVLVVSLIHQFLRARLP